MLRSPSLIARLGIPWIAVTCLGLTVACGDDGGGSEGSGTDSDTEGATETDPTTDPSDPTTDPTNTTDPTTGDPTTGPTTDPTTTDPTTGPTTTDSTDTDATTGNNGEFAAFRVNTIEVRDPHFFAPLLGDVTEGNVNEPLNEGLSTDMDDPPDGFLDLGFVLLFRPLDQTDQGGADFEFANAQCTAPVETTTCDLLPDSTVYTSTYTNTEAANDTCLEADPVNLSEYDDPPGPPTPTAGPCFVSGSVDVVIEAGSFSLPLSMATVAAQYDGDPAATLVEGNIQGFLTQADAEATIVDVPLLGPTPLADLLREEDMDEDMTGWWMHIAFTAEPVEWTGG